MEPRPNTKRIGTVDAASITKAGRTIRMMLPKSGWASRRAETVPRIVPTGTKTCQKLSSSPSFLVMAAASTESDANLANSAAWIVNGPTSIHLVAPPRVSPTRRVRTSMNTEPT